MGSSDIVERLRQSVDDHDIDALVACFAEDYRNETPAHPARGFVGREAVRANWERLFSGLSDITATVHRRATDGDTVWTEWEMAGRRADGAAHVLRGVIIFGTADERIAWGRFYLEPLDAGEGGVDAAIDRIVGNGGRR